MKQFVVLSLIIALCSAEYVVKTRENWLEYRNACITELSVPSDLVEKYQKWEYPNDSITQCYLKCVFCKFGLFDSLTGFNAENVHAQLSGGTKIDDNEELNGKINTCIDNNDQGTNACEWAYRGGSCLLKNHLELIQKSLMPATTTPTTTKTEE